MVAVLWLLQLNGPSTLPPPPPAPLARRAPTPLPTASAQCLAQPSAVGLGRIGFLLRVWLGVLLVRWEPMATGLRHFAPLVPQEPLLA